jgi:hypothetical protein
MYTSGQVCLQGVSGDPRAPVAQRLPYKGSPAREYSVRSRLGMTERAFEGSGGLDRI